MISPEPQTARLKICSLTILTGAYGECGLRGGYMELHNMDPEVLDELYKIASINLSPNTPGQVSQNMTRKTQSDTDSITN